jgi:AcrR family transcriptional regulator
MIESPPINRRDQRREAILKIAQEVFSEEGFAAASMSTIAARLGGSKGTLYNYFRSKDELFACYIEAECARVAEETFSHYLADDEPVELVLQRVGEALLKHIYSMWSVSNFRLMVAEAKRTPQLARIFYAAGPAVGRERMAAYFERATKRGALTIADGAYMRAVEQFMGLCRGDVHFQLVLNLIEAPGPDQIRSDVAAATRTFMAAFGPQVRAAA